MPSLETSIRESLLKFAAHLAETRWRGREREAVSLFAFGFLQKHFENPTRIAIEAAVVQLHGKGKRQVCKDLVIWPRPGMTVWDDSWQLRNDPSCIIEWKVASKQSHKPPSSGADVDWLRSFSSTRPAFEGYVVAVDLQVRNFLISVTRVKANIVSAGWLVCN
jgi:hypothetical protein